MKTPSEWMEDRHPKIAKSLDGITQRHIVELLMESYALYFAEEISKDSNKLVK